MGDPTHCNMCQRFLAYYHISGLRLQMRLLDCTPSHIITPCKYFFSCLQDMVVLPYKDSLLLFSRYLQQLVMESLGKEFDLEGNKVNLVLCRSLSAKPLVRFFNSF
jgi:hypothetical protein